MNLHAESNLAKYRVLKGSLIFIYRSLTFREIITLCSNKRTRPVNKFFVQNSLFYVLKRLVHIVACTLNGYTIHFVV